MYSLKSYEKTGGIKTASWCGKGRAAGNAGLRVKIRSGLYALHAETAEREEVVDRMNGGDSDQLRQKGI